MLWDIACLAGQVGLYCWLAMLGFRLVEELLRGWVK